MIYFDPSFTGPKTQNEQNQLRVGQGNIPHTQFYEYLGLGMVIDTQYLGYWLLGMGWVSGYFEYLGLGISWVDIPKPIPKTQLFGV